MFFPKAMSEIELIVPSRDLLKVMKVLSGHGVFHQAEGNYGGPQAEAEDGNPWQEKASAYAGLERRVQNLMQALEIEPSSEGAFRDVVEVESVEPTLERIETEVKHTTDALSENRKRLDQLESDLRQVEPVADIGVNLSTLGDSHFLFSMLGAMPAENVARLRTSLGRIPHVFLILREDSKRPVVWLAGTQDGKDVLERSARSAYVEALSLPAHYAGTPAEIMVSLQGEIESTRRQISVLEAELRRAAVEHRKDLLNLAWEIHASRTLAEAIVRFGRLRHTYIMVGWVPTDDLETLVQRLHQTSRETLIETIPANRAGDKARVPVALQQSKFLRPFQLLVTTYARPRYGELDPTWLIALTFPLLFGAMFGDVGHGLLLAGLGALISSRKVKILKSLAGLGGLIAICGVVASAFGFLYGSIFGFEDVIPALWLRPSKDPLTILAVAVGAGVVLLTSGFLVGIINSVISRAWPRLVFGQNSIAGLLLYWSLLGGAAAYFHLVPLPFNLFVLIAILAAVMIMFSEVFTRLVEGERPLIEGGIVVYAFQAFMELFEAVITFVSNSLSYIRVGAFAIAHVVLSTVVFLLAGLVGPAHGIGYWTVVIIGNLFIVGFEGLIVGIQAMRLSYYEFFSKFFTGGGMRFEPLTLSSAAEE